jgi:hypothetical protein
LAGLRTAGDPGKPRPALRLASLQVFLDFLPEIPIRCAQTRAQNVRMAPE